MSLGKTHDLLGALLGRGWVKAQKFRRSDRKPRDLYVLTPQGVRQRMQFIRLFPARKEREYEMLTRQIVAARRVGAAGRKAAMNVAPEKVALITA